MGLSDPDSDLRRRGSAGAGACFACPPRARWSDSRRRPPGNNLEVKPYAIGGLTSGAAGLNAGAARWVEGDGKAGVDLKYGVTQNLTADFTLNTDFAQVEVDEQQVNLTRFSLFFPEKREFFLEGRGIFDFARGSFRTARSLRQGSVRGGGDAPTALLQPSHRLQAGRRCRSSAADA